VLFPVLFFVDGLAAVFVLAFIAVFFLAADLTAGGFFRGEDFFSPAIFSSQKTLFELTAYFLQAASSQLFSVVF